MKRLLPSSLLALALMLPVAQVFAVSSTFTWDSGGLSPAAPNSAAGIWDTTNAYWSNGAVDSAWNNANADTAIFGGSTSYTVTLSGGLTVGGLLFSNTSGAIVTLQSSTLTLSGSSVLIKQTDGGSSMTINSLITGTSSVTFTVANVTLGSANTYTGSTTTITSGYVRLGVSNALPTNTNLVLSGGTLMFINAGATTQTVQSLSGNNTSARGVWGRVNGGSTLIVNGTSTTTYGGQIINDTTATQAQNIEVAGSTNLTLTNTTGLTYRGTTKVSDTAVLNLGLGANLTNTSSVTVAGGTLRSAGGSISLGAGNVSMSAGAITPGGVSTVGTFVVAADKTFSTTGGTISLDLGTTSDAIVGSGTGTFSLTNTALALNLGTGFSYGGTYAVFNGFTSGSLSNVTISGYDSANYTAALSNGGVLSFSAVPEPTVPALLGGAGVALILIRRSLRRLA